MRVLADIVWRHISNHRPLLFNLVSFCRDEFRFLGPEDDKHWNLPEGEVKDSLKEVEAFVNVEVASNDVAAFLIFKVTGSPELIFNVAFDDEALSKADHSKKINVDIHSEQESHDKLQVFQTTLLILEATMQLILALHKCRLFSGHRSQDLLLDQPHNVVEDTDLQELQAGVHDPEGARA